LRFPSSVIRHPKGSAKALEKKPGEPILATGRKHLD